MNSFHLKRIISLLCAYIKEIFLVLLIVIYGKNVVFLKCSEWNEKFIEKKYFREMKPRQYFNLVEIEKPKTQVIF